MLSHQFSCSFSGGAAKFSDVVELLKGSAFNCPSLKYVKTDLYKCD